VKALMATSTATNPRRGQRIGVSASAWRR
jgi:hypothetical protein